MASFRVTCLALVVLSALSLAQAGPLVADGYETFSQVQGSRYKLYTFTATWQQASVTCQLDGGGAHLIVINSEAERQVVQILFSRIRDSTRHLYVGINDLAYEGNWVTVTGGLMANSGYTTWDKGQPDSKGNEDCGSVVRSGTYNDLTCSLKRPFICEKPNA